jgi:hypothetical protein
MIKSFRSLALLSALIWLTRAPQIAPAQTANAGAESGIRLSAFVEKISVPLNRTVLFTIRMEWFGDLDKYEVHQLDNPLAQNLDIIGTGSSNRVANTEGRNTSILDYEYTLKPQSLGMAYVEGVIITYTDRETDKEYRLVTNRIEVKVIDPLPEPGSNAWIIWLACVVIIMGIATVVIRTVRRKKIEQEERAKNEAIAAVPAEEAFLKQIREQINLQDPDINLAGSFANLSRILRRFLAEKLEAPGLEATTEEVILSLRKKSLDERFILETCEILTKADQAKFSGGAIEKSELERALTLFEANLQRSLRGELEKPTAPEKSEND